MGGKGSSSAPPAFQPTTADQYILGSTDPLTGQPMLNPNYIKPTPFELPSFHPPGGPSSSTDYASKLEAQRQKDLSTQGQNSRDSLYADYMTAAGSATDYVNNQITQEQSNADLLGINYSINDAQKTQRISDYFASIWGEGDQVKLESLFSKWGNPQGFDSFSVKRGDGSAYAGNSKASEKMAAVTAGTRPGGLGTLATTSAEEDLLGGQTILGG